MGEHKRCQARPITSSMQQHLATKFRVMTYYGPFLFGQWTGLIQDSRGDGEFTEIMHECCQANAIYLILRQPEQVGYCLCRPHQAIRVCNDISSPGESSCFARIDNR